MWNSISRLHQPENLRDSIRWAYVLFAWLGIGISIYGAITFLFSWVPKSSGAVGGWGSYNEDGEFEPPVVGFFLALFGSLTLLTSLVRVPRAIHDLETANDAITHFYTLLRRQIDQLFTTGTHAHSQLSEVLEELEKEAREIERDGLWHDGRRYSVDVKPSLRLISLVRHLINADRQRRING
jgi:hypothetical protein